MPAARLWQAAGTQWRGAGFGIIGLDWPAVMAIAAVLHIDMDERLFAKIEHLEKLELERLNRKD